MGSGQGLIMAPLSKSGGTQSEVADDSDLMHTVNNGEKEDTNPLTAHNCPLQAWKQSRLRRG